MLDDMLYKHIIKATEKFGKKWVEILDETIKIAIAYKGLRKMGLTEKEAKKAIWTYLTEKKKKIADNIKKTLKNIEGNIKEVLGDIEKSEEVKENLETAKKMQKIGLEVLEKRIGKILGSFKKIR